MKKLNIQIIGAADKINHPNYSQRYLKKPLVTKSGIRTIIIGYEGEIYKYIYTYGPGYGLCFISDSSEKCIYSTRYSGLNTELGFNLQYTIMMLSPIKYELV